MNFLKITRDIKILRENWGTAEFMSVTVYGKEIATSARSFTASDPQLTLSECDYCYHCGVPEISVRRTSDDHVIWFLDSDDDHTPTLSRDIVLEFDRNQYESCLGGNVNQLPEIDRRDLELILSQITLPRWEDALYTIPDLPNDSFGKNTIRLISDAITDNRVIPFTHRCNAVSSLLIGLDVDKIPETELLIASEEDETLFRFGKHPHLPIWMKIHDDPHPFINLHADSEIAE